MSDDNLESELAATFDKLETGDSAAVSAARPAVANQKDLEAAVTELQARLSLTEESYSVAIKERDAADEARKKLERTLAEFLARFASVRETQSAAFKEVEKLGSVRREMEKKVSDLQAELTATEEARAAALRARDEAMAHLAPIQKELEETRQQFAPVKKELEEARAQLAPVKKELDEARLQLASFRDMAVTSLEPLAKEHSRGMKDLMDEAESMMQEALRLRDETAQQFEKLAEMAGSMKSHINTKRRDMGEQMSAVLGTPEDVSGQRDDVAANGNGNGVSHARPVPALAQAG